MDGDELAEKIYWLLYENDAYLCSIPHGQYETYTPWPKSRAVEKIKETLMEIVNEETH